MGLEGERKEGEEMHAWSELEEWILRMGKSDIYVGSEWTLICLLLEFMARI